MMYNYRHGLPRTQLLQRSARRRRCSGGAVRKRFAATRMNERSSRAHCVVCLRARQTRGDAMVSSTLHLVDLAGSERIKKSGC